jgi:hypothetical protein
MTHIALPPNRVPALSLPASLTSDASLAVFDDFPDGQDWVQEVLTHVNERTRSKDFSQVKQLVHLEAGAPVGRFTTESYRVARAFGVVTKPSADSEEPASTSVLGGCLAQGLCYATWKQGSSGRFLVVTFNAPSSVGWGQGRGLLSLEYLKARCIQQFAHQARSLLEHVQDLGEARAVLTEFLGDWGPETEHLRRGLMSTCVLSWVSRVTALRQDDSSCGLLVVEGALD